MSEATGASTTQAPPPLEPAATLVPLRDGVAGIEILMLRRSKRVGFIGGTWVFPGGGVEACDCENGVAEDSEAAGLRCAVRETQEEAGLHFATEQLLPIAHWVAPVESPRRYATWFFLSATSDTDVEVQVDGSEIHQHRWLSPATALAALQSGEMKFLPPTYVTLLWLQAFNSTITALAAFRDRPIVRFTPRTSVRDDIIYSLYKEDAGYAEATPEQPGARHRVAAQMGGGKWSYEIDFPGDEVVRRDSQHPNSSNLS